MPKTKICSRCHLDIPITDFEIYDGIKIKRRSYCKLCDKERTHEYYLKNKDKISKNIKEYAKNNADAIKAYKKQWYLDNRERTKDQSKINKKNYKENNSEKIKKQSKIYYLNNIDKIKQYQKNSADAQKQKRKEYRENNWELIRNREKLNQTKKRSDPLYRLKDAIRCRIRNSLRNNGYSKKSKSMLILGCSYDNLKLYIEARFESWMNWENYGLYNGTEKYGWDIDHVIPLSTAKTEEDVLRLNHYTNLQPLCGYHNRVIKRNATT